MMIAVRLAGVKVGDILVTIPQAHFSLESFDPSTVSSPKRFEWVKMNIDIGAPVNTFPMHFWSRLSRRRDVFSNGHCECILDGGAQQFQGYVESDLCRSLNGRFTGVHRVLCSLGEVACKGKKKRLVYS